MIRYKFKTADLMLHSPGIEVAAFPILYPRHCFGDTDSKERGLLKDASQASIFASHLRKLLSSCTGYMLQPRLTFLLYDIAMAQRLIGAIKVAESRGFSAEVTTGHYTDSETYWRHEQDISCDMVRQMAALCDVPSDTEDGRRLYEFCNHGATKQRLAFPNYFITVAPAEWLFPLPAWLQELAADNLSDLSGIVALHIYHVLLVALKEVLKPGQWFSDVFHYCLRIEFQGRGTIHAHVAVWAIARDGMDLEGRTGEQYGSPLVHGVRQVGFQLPQPGVNGPRDISPLRVSS